MPNWTDVTLRCDGLSDLPIFSTDDNGEKYFDYNKIIPIPEFTKNTISPVREDCVLTFLLKENSLEDALSKFKDYGFTLKDEYKGLSKDQILEITDKPEHLGIHDESPELSAYDLGKNYIISHEKTGCWDWYDWTNSNWGVKWNASDSCLDGDTLTFMAPWGYPDKVFEKMTEMFPDKNFYAEIIYEDDFETIYTLDFSADHYFEGQEVNPAFLEELEDDITFRLGLYNQVNAMYPTDMEESKAYGIAIQSYRDDEPYGTVTTNLQSRLGDFCEMISIKNSAYIDLNNNPWATILLDKGIARDTGYKKESGFCEYPLWQFDEDWLKKLKPIENTRTYDDYEKKYNKAMGLDIGDDEMNTEYTAGTRVILEYMEGENPSRMYNGLEGTVTSVDDIGQIHVNWDNGSSLALNPDCDRFSKIEENKIDMTIRPATEEERDYTYTHDSKRMENSGCIGHLRVDMDTDGFGFYTDWTDHCIEFNDARFKNDFDKIINSLRDNSEFEGIFSNRDSMRKYCQKYSDEASFSEEKSGTYGFRVDYEDITCMLRLDPSPANYAAYVYAYVKDTLADYMKEQRNREKISVLCINPGKEPEVKEIYKDLESLQSEVSGLIECIYPWDDDAGIICNEEGKIEGLPLNRALRDDEGEIYDVIAGTMLVVGLTEDDFGSLTDEQINTYTDLFKSPETIITIDGKIAAVPSDDFKQIPVYYNNSKYASEVGELTAYRESFKANMACKKAIEQTLSDCYKDNILDSKTASKTIIEEFGEERVKLVLANTCIHKDWDARISNENKAWANTVKVPDYKDSFGDDNSKYFICEKPHIGLVDLLCSRVRKDCAKEKSRDIKKSVIDKLISNSDKIDISKKQTNPNKKEKSL